MAGGIRTLLRMPRGLIGKRAAGVAAKRNNVALTQHFQRLFGGLPPPHQDGGEQLLGRIEAGA
jgi:hypothetical protein